MSGLAIQVESIARHRTPSSIFDEEAAIGGHGDKTLSQPSSQSTLRVDEGEHELVTDVFLVRPWNRFIRKGRKNVGVTESLKAIVLSSCTHSSLLVLKFTRSGH